MPLAIGIVIAVALVIVTLIAFVTTRPTDFRVERSAQVNAPRDVVFAIINDLHQWSAWSPFEKYDPNMKKSFDGPDAGPGAGFAWNGNSRAGEGRIRIVSTKPGELITMNLEFTRPYKATNEVNFKLVPTDRGTRVSWIMDGKKNFMFKAFSLFMDMDAMVGKDFEEGLANLNNVALGTGAQA